MLEDISEIKIHKETLKQAKKVMRIGEVSESQINDRTKLR